MMASTGSLPVPGTRPRGTLPAVDSSTPFGATTSGVFPLLAKIYESLLEPNPLCSTATTPGVTTCSQPLQLMDWVTSSHPIHKLQRLGAGCYARCCRG